jgi:hypothetical protein
MPPFSFIFYSLQYKFIQSLIRIHSRRSFGNSSLLSLSKQSPPSMGCQAEIWTPGLPYSRPAQYHLSYAPFGHRKYIQRKDFSWTCCQMARIHTVVTVAELLATPWQGIKTWKDDDNFPPIATIRWKLQFWHFSNFWITSRLISLFIGHWSSNLGLNKITTWQLVCTLPDT